MNGKKDVDRISTPESRKHGGKSAFLLFLALSCSTTVFAQSDASQYAGGDVCSEHQTRTHLFRDWDGERSALALRGITFDFFYVADLQANPIGGLEQTKAGWGRIRGTMDVDFGKLTDWNPGRSVAYLLC
jgi:hypothetical protein